MLDPYLVKSDGLGKRFAPTYLDHVTRTSSNNADLIAVGKSRLIGKLLAGGDRQMEVPIDTRKQSAGVQFSNNANQIRVGSVEDGSQAQFRVERRRDRNSRRKGGY